MLDMARDPHQVENALAGSIVAGRGRPRPAAGRWQGQAVSRAGATQLSVPSPTARRAFSTCTQSWALMPATAPTKSVHAAKKESAACTKPEVALSLVVRAR